MAFEAHPLQWPVGYKKTPANRRAFSRFKVTPAVAQKLLRDELRKLGVHSVIISTNIPVKKDGSIYADMSDEMIDDPGVAIYFKWKGKDVAMCCDTYARVWENIQALYKSVEGIRTIERHGVAEFLDRAFTGFKALPDTIEMDYAWYKILNVSENATVEQIKAAYKAKVKIVHPDAGGSVASFNLIQKAYDQGMSLHQ